MKIVRAVCAIGVLMSAQAAYAKIRSPSDQDKLQAACYGDVQKLCKDAIPDEDKITACMKSQQSKISASCVRAYKATQTD